MTAANPDAQGARFRQAFFSADRVVTIVVLCLAALLVCTGLISSAFEASPSPGYCYSSFCSPIAAAFGRSFTILIPGILVLLNAALSIVALVRRRSAATLALLLLLAQIAAPSAGTLILSHFG